MVESEPDALIICIACGGKSCASCECCYLHRAPDCGCPCHPAFAAGTDRARETLVLIDAIWRRPDEGHSDYFERMAADFHRQTGLMAPGKSQPLEMGDNETKRRAAWEEFYNAPYRALQAALERMGGSDVQRQAEARDC